MPSADSTPLVYSHGSPSSSTTQIPRGSEDEFEPEDEKAGHQSGGRARRRWRATRSQSQRSMNLGLMLSLLSATLLLMVAAFSILVVTYAHAEHSRLHDQVTTSPPPSEPAETSLAHYNIQIDDQSIPTTPSGLVLKCGDTAASAKARGCTFDVLIVAWMPPACYDAPVALDGVSPTSGLAASGGAGNWSVHLDKNFTQPINHETLSLREQDSYWVTFNFHRAHCLHLWQLTSSAVERLKRGEREVYVYEPALSLEHVRHCNKVMLDRERELESPEHVVVGFGKCKRLDVE